MLPSWFLCFALIQPVKAGVHRTVKHGAWDSSRDLQFYPIFSFQVTSSLSFYCYKNAGCKQFSPLDFSLSLRMLEGSLWSEPPLFCLVVLSLPHVCLCRFVSRLALLNGDQEGSPAVFLVFSLHAEKELLSKEQHFSREVHKGSTNSAWVFSLLSFFFFFELLLKTSAKHYQWDGKSTKNLKCSWTSL